MLPLLAVATLAQWHTVTVYDVLPEACRATVGNNDVGNAPGDMYCACANHDQRLSILLYFLPCSAALLPLFF